MIIQASAYSCGGDVQFLSNIINCNFLALFHLTIGCLKQFFKKELKIKKLIDYRFKKFYYILKAVTVAGFKKKFVTATDCRIS